jgi:hypothetical protein
MNGSSTHLLQVAFAVSPFPSYLPQYFSIMQQLSSPDSKDDSSSSESSAVAREPLGTTIDRGGDQLRKRNPPDAGVASPPNSTGVDWMLHGTPSKLFEDEKKLDTGLSRATVLLLLSAHLLRLLYFHGLILISEEQRADALLKPRALVIPTAISATYSPTETSVLQWDLVGQSVSMIVMQLLLLHTMMLLRRKQLKMQMKRVCERENVGHTNSSESSSSYSPSTAEPLMSGSIAATALESSNHNYSNKNTSPENFNSQNMPYRRTKRHQFYRATIDHLHRILSPHNILQSHSFLEYCEVLLLASIITKLAFDYRWYPRYGIQVVQGLKHMSIVLESCLALPQAIRNHRKGTTEGLSVSYQLEDN